MPDKDALRAAVFKAVEDYCAADFGYSFDPKEVIDKWGRKEIVGDFVRLIRTFRPDVVLTMNMQGRGGDRAHEATTVLTREAYDAAGDPAKYPEQGLRPWQPKKLYMSAGFGGGRGGPAAPPAPATPAVKLATVNTGIVDSLLGRTYKIKWLDSDHAFYITINDIEKDGRRRPFEVFINSQNMEAYAWALALTRMISAVFRRGGDVSFVVDELKAIFDPRGGQWMGGRYVPSLLAAIGEVIERHMIEIGFLGLRGPAPAAATGSQARRALGSPRLARAIQSTASAAPYAAATTVVAKAAAATRIASKGASSASPRVPSPQ